MRNIINKIKQSFLSTIVTTRESSESQYRVSRKKFLYQNTTTVHDCCNNANYPTKGEIGYDPRKKLGMVFSKLSEKFASTWIPRQHVAIDKGTIPFKGSIHFKVYNANKPDKYGIKTWKLCDSSNSYCCQFDIYVAYQYPNPTKYGNTYDLVMRFLDPYKNLGYIACLLYTSPSPRDGLLSRMPSSA